MSEPSPREFDAVITGRSLPALQTALDLSEVGLRVALAPEASSHSEWVVDRDGNVRTPEADRAAETDQTQWAEVAELDAEGSIASLLTRIAQPIEGSNSEAHSSAQPTRTVPTSALLRDAKGRWAEQASPEVLGVPAVPLAEQVIALVGMGGALRAYFDRFTPLLTVGKTRSLGKLVQKRMGKQVLRRLVEPQVLERYGKVSREVDVAIAAPGLNEALSRAGALSAAVLACAERHVARETRVYASGGWSDVALQALRKLELYGVQQLNSSISRVREAETGWLLNGGDHERIQARALVFDQGSASERHAIAPEPIDSLLPDEVRVYAEIETDSPGWFDDSTFAITSVGDWSLRVERSLLASGDSGDSGAQRQPAGPMLATLSSIALPAGGFSPESGLASLVDELETQLASVDLSPVAGAYWRVRVKAAAFCQIDQRHMTQREYKELRQEHPTLLPVGRALHADDLSSALASAHTEAISLRRRLLGLDGDDE